MLHIDSVAIVTLLYVVHSSTTCNAHNTQQHFLKVSQKTQMDPAFLSLLGHIPVLGQEQYCYERQTAMLYSSKTSKQPTIQSTVGLFLLSHSITNFFNLRSGLKKGVYNVFVHYAYKAEIKFNEKNN